MLIRTRMIELSENVRGSYWFLPTLLAFAGFALGLSLVLVDAWLGDAWLGQYEWFYGSRPEGARAMLSTIAGSTITVAGVVFSITLVAVTYSSGRFGPRLLGNFMRDRGNQASLGVFIGTYLYCLVVLRTIRSAEETSADTGGAVRDSFVPHLAMFGGLALAIASTAVLIYFVHHVTSGIHINNVIARVGRDLIAQIRRQGNEDDSEPGPTSAPSSAGKGEPIIATKTGYIEAIDFDALLKIASRHDLVLRPVRRAGDFVAEGWTLLEAHSAASICDRMRDECTSVVTVGRQRTAQQDLRFGIDELVEIAARALSPGVNDPFTAIACIDWLGAALGELDRRPPPPTQMADDDGTARIILRPLDFKDHLDAAFGQLRSYVAADPNARDHALNTLKDLATHVGKPRHRTLVEAERAQLAAMEPSGDV
ncbi:MAG: DUF2254 domain-containing protein [Pseudomonadota bacterium]|nr:DUF2254 domain-containing protein [Pseudomonadota bacterium]